MLKIPKLEKMLKSYKSKREIGRNIDAQPKSNPKIFKSHVPSKLKTKTDVATMLQDEIIKTLRKV